MSATILINLLKKNKNRVSMADLRAAMVSEYGNAVADVQTRRSVDAARRAGAVLESVRDGRKVSALLAVGALPEIGAKKPKAKVAKPKAKVAKPKVIITKALQKSVAAKIEKTDAELAAIKAKNLETMKKVSAKFNKFEKEKEEVLAEFDQENAELDEMDPSDFVPGFLLKKKEKYVE